MPETGDEMKSKFAHSIKNPQIMHYMITRDKRKRYLCNGACSITPKKIALTEHEVTCKNCLYLMDKAERYEESLAKPKEKKSCQKQRGRKE